MKVRKGYQALFLFFLVLAVYYPAIFAGVNSVDDMKMLYTLEELVKRDIWSLFLPGADFYYRPILMLSFTWDFLLWGNNPSFFHLTNIFIHAANVLIVFFIGQTLLSEGNDESKNIWPFGAALLFAIHPIVTESVNWISGRTDLLGGFFSLLAIWVIIKAIQMRTLYLIWLSVFVLACAIMSKEVMVFVIPVAIFLIWRNPHDKIWRGKALLFFMFPFVVGGGGFFYLRALKHGLGAGFGSLIENYGYGVFDTFRVFFKVLGFYFKKIIFPMPLNFAITNAADAYVFLGLAVFLLSFFLLRYKKLTIDFFIISFFLILPGIIIALTNVAWTPLAERYIYLSTAFFCLGVGGTLPLSKKINSSRRKTMLVGFPVFLFLFLFFTIERNVVWKDNFTLYSDAVKKSNNFSAMHNELAISLIEKGDFDQAEKVIEKGKSRGNATPLLFVNHARIYIERDDLGAARKIILKVCSDKKTANLEALKVLAKIDELRLEKEPLEKVGEALVDTYKYLIERDGDPFFSYRLAQILFALGDKKESFGYFKSAYENSPPDAHYKAASKKFITRLSSESNL
jgi:tetratricopeptide (TPR) repeat protein